MTYPLKSVADHIASKGRNGDTELVHINRDELRGLAALHPRGRLPINPETGHAEAFDLGGMLSSLAGGTAGFFVGGPMGAAIGSGLGSYAYSGDLGQGIASGLLSYGLGSAVSGLGGAGGEAAAGAAGGAAGGAGGTGAGLATGMTSSVLDPAAMTSTSAIDHALAGGPGGTLGSQAGAALNVPAPDFLHNIGSGITDKIGDYGQQLSRAGSNLTNPDTLWDTFGKNALKTTVPIALGAYGMAGGLGGSGGGYMPQQQQSYGPASTQGTGRQYQPAPAGYRPGKDPEWNYFSRGYADGGGISGPGGGLDDAIPAIIDGRHPAQLSSGEYVVPAHAVSALGNGSTEEGVRQMDGMVSKVMKHKFGTTNRKPRPMQAHKMMPV